MPTVAIVGASGNVGRELVRLLLARGVAVRALGRDSGKLAALAASGAQSDVANLHDPRALAAAFRGVDGLFAMVPTTLDHHDPRAYQRQVADAMAAGLQVARVRFAVTLSSIGADQQGATGPIAGLREMEERFNQVPGLAVVHLRAGFFYENFLASIPLIKARGVNGGLIRPDLAMTMIASRDVAAAGADVLGDLSFTGQRTRELQGPRPYTMAEATRIIGTAIGRPDLGYVQFSEPDTLQAFVGAGCSQAVAALYVEMLTAFNQGLVKAREPRSAANTTPTTLEDFAGAVFAPAFQR